ncbi:MAG: hypothetical protein IKG61_10625 [Selenomonadaceae bacterium]|nr:hypothetical protein [Selenomonadaceae bacterium]
MEGELLLKLLMNVGAPVGICFYTLYGVNNTLKEQDKTFKELAKVMDIFTKEIERRDYEHATKLERLEEKVRDLTFKVDTHCHSNNSSKN